MPRVHVGVIGCGKIGTRRAQTAAERGDIVRIVVDIELDRARDLAHGLGARSSADWGDALVPDVDVVVISTVNSAVAEIAVSALRAGKHVLCEKPMGRNGGEARTIAAAVRESGRLLKVGFNHRYHPGMIHARQLATSGEIGACLLVRATYGHGGRPGYEKEWRGDPARAGGGELLDQGVHVIDLCRWFLGDFVEAAGMLATMAWPVEPLEDNGFALLRTAKNQVATIHTSWTQWRNLFRFEVFGNKGYLIVNGLGGTYGPEELVLGVRDPESRPPTETRWSYAGPDTSWRDEWADFVGGIARGSLSQSGADDGVAVACVVDAIYRSARERRTVRIDPHGSDRGVVLD